MEMENFVKRAEKDLLLTIERIARERKIEEEDVKDHGQNGSGKI